MEIISHKYVLIRNHSFDSRHHDMVFERAGKLLHSALDKSRGNGKNNNVGIGYHIIDVVEKLDFGGVENQGVEKSPLKTPKKCLTFNPKKNDQRKYHSSRNIYAPLP